MFPKTSSKLFAVLAAIAMLTASFLFGFDTGRRAGSQDDFAVLEEADRLIRRSALRSPARKVLLKAAVRGMLQGLDDPYSAYLTPQAYRNLKDDQAEGQFSGVGLWMKEEDSRFKVVSVLDSSPAAAAGLQEGDLIVQIDSGPVEGLDLDEVSGRIQGRPGTTVRLVVEREKATREFVIVRRKLDLPTVSSRMLADGVGLIELVLFHGEAGRKVREAVTSLEKRGARGFILDLRGNPGGFLDEAVDVAAVFLEGGKVVSYRERGQADVVYEAMSPIVTKLPLVVIVDEGSASASEVVAGAIQDRQRGLIVGAETYGKGSVQSFLPLSDGSAIKLTTASYFTPSGRAIGTRGVIPDISVPDSDRQLARAKEVITGILAEAPG